MKVGNIDLDFSNKKLRPVIASRAACFGDISQVSGDPIEDPLSLLQSKEQATLPELIEAIIYWVQSEFGTKEFALAQTEFQALTGKVFYDEVYYHQKASYFLDYFCFERPLLSNDLTPYKRFMDSKKYAELHLSPKVREQFQELELFLHNLFRVLRNRKDKLLLKSLTLDKKFEIQALQDFQFKGLEKGDVVQGFLFQLGEGPQLSSGIIVHPAKVLGIIKKHIKKLKKSPTSQNHFLYLIQLAKTHLNFVRQRKVDVKKLYSKLAT